MQYPVDFTIDHMVKFVNGELVDEPDKFLGDPDEQARLDKFGFKDHRVSRDAVYHWMLKAGCTLEVAGQCYYTDRHNDEDVVKFRNEVYTPSMEKIEERAYVWLYFNASIMG